MKTKKPWSKKIGKHEVMTIEKLVADQCPHYPQVHIHFTSNEIGRLDIRLAVAFKYECVEVTGYIEAGQSHRWLAVDKAGQALQQAIRKAREYQGQKPLIDIVCDLFSLDMESDTRADARARGQRLREEYAAAYGSNDKIN